MNVQPSHDAALMSPPFRQQKVVHAAPVLLVLLFSKFIAFAVSILIARLFGREEAGLVFFVTGLVALSMSFTTFGFGAAANYYYARNQARGRHNRNLQILVLAVIMAALPSVAIASLGLLMEKPTFIPAPLLVGLLGLSCYFAACRQIARYFFVIEGNRAWSIIHEGVVFNVALAICLIVVPDRSYEAALWAVLAASVLSGSLAIVHLVHTVRYGRDRMRLSLPPRRYARTILAVAIPSMVTQASAVLLNKIDVVMIGPLAGAVAVSEYSVAMRLTYVTTAAGEVLIALAATRLVHAAATGSPATQWRLLRKLTLAQGFLVLVTSVPLFAFAGPLLILTYGPDFHTAALPFVILQAGKLLTALFAPALILFTGLGYNRELARNAVLALGLNIVLNFALVPSFGASGAAVATTLALALMATRYASLTWRVRCRQLTPAVAAMDERQ